jgi:glycosyltransferase involved in cell wall biosynthesis
VKRTVGVVIPTYNRADFLPATLKSILAQTLLPNDILVVDDGSTDDTGTVLSSFSDCVRSVTVSNGGDLRARNIGMDDLKTDLVAFCDSDDLWEAGFLEKALGFWEIEPDLLAFYSNFRILQDGRLSKTTKLDDAPTDFLSGSKSVPGGVIFTREFVAQIIRFQPLFTSCMVAHRVKLQEMGGWDEGTSRMVGSDFATALRVAGSSPVALGKEPLVYIRKHGGNFSGNSEKMNFGDADVLEYVYNTRPELASKREVIRSSIAARRAAGIDAAFARGDFGTFNKYYSSLPPAFRTPKRTLKRLIAWSAKTFNPSTYSHFEGLW